MNKSVKDFFEKCGGSLAVPFAMIVVGLFFLLFPGSAVNMTVKVIGIIFIAIGLILAGTLIAAFSVITLVLAVILLAVGIVCLASPGVVATFVIKILGIIILISSVLSIRDAYEIKGKSDRFTQYIINDLITFVLGAILIIMPLGAAAILVRIVGAVMIILGVSNVVMAVRVYKDGKYINDGTDVVWEE